MEYPSFGSLLAQQTGYQSKLLYRTPIAVFFTLIFPIMLMVIFGAIFGNEEIPALGITVAQHFVGGLAVYAAASAAYTNIGVGTAYQRDQGVLKRFKGSPLSPAVFFAGKIISAVLIAFIAVVLMFVVGVLLYDVKIFSDLLPAALLTFFVGVGCFAALGLLVAAVSPTGSAATAIANATLLPVAFLSGVFIPEETLRDGAPQWMIAVGEIFPLKAFNVAFQMAFLPVTSPPGIDWGALGFMALWGAAAAVLSLRLFKWESKRI